ncbi:MAG: hypothetical protein RL293_853 [Bacteroidota bacterium]|jgi:hypothetical protein
MEEQLKNILKNHKTFAELNDFDRKQLVEWCADEQEFQSLKKLFQHVDAWSDKPTDDSNTKIRLDQLFAIQYAGKQSTSNGKEIQFTKNRFSRVATWTSISAVAAALVLTWYVYQPAPEITLAKNTVKTQPKDKRVETEKTAELNGEDVILPPVAAESVNEEIPTKIATVEGPLPEMSEMSDDVQQTMAPTVSWSDNLANGSALTLSASNTGATGYTWTSDNFSEVSVISSKMISTEKISSRKKQADAFTSFNVKSMPEMLDVIVAAY